MQIHPDHPDATDPVLHGVAEVLRGRGARVIIDAAGDNLVELVGIDGCQVPRVRAQGLPNLLHECVHVLNAGRLADDHGIDYGAMPFELTQPEGRAVLWDELACCVLSCAYLRDAEAVDGWFAEQLEIQPVFYGHERAPDRFWTAIEAVESAYGHERCRVLARARSQLEASLRAVGLARPAARPRQALSFGRLWARFRDRRAGASCEKSA